MIFTIIYGHRNNGGSNITKQKDGSEETSLFNNATGKGDVDVSSPFAAKPLDYSEMVELHDPSHIGGHHDAEHNKENLHNGAEHSKDAKPNDGKMEHHDDADKMKHQEKDHKSE